MLRKLAAEVITKFLEEKYCSGDTASINYNHELDSSYVTISLNIIKQSKEFGFSVTKTATKNIQSFRYFGLSVISFGNYCQEIVDEFTKNKNESEKFQKKIDADIEFIVQGMPSFSSTFHSFFGFDPARPEKSNENDLLESVEPFSDLLKKANLEGRNNQLTLSSIQIELLAATAGNSNYSKDKLIHALEILAVQYTDMANKSRAENK